MARMRGRPLTGAITTIKEALQKAGVRPAENAVQGVKKNYAEQLSRYIATCIANALRSRFSGIMPSEDGTQQESPARTAKGLEKLDVNYSTPQLGLALGVSIKPINFRDAATRRYTKNYGRNDNELRAEATDYHQRQPYAVLVGVLFMPFDSCDDGTTGKREEQHISSFGAAAKYFRSRSNRTSPRDDIDLFERFFIALYEQDGTTVFFDVMTRPPRNRRPTADEVISFDQLAVEITKTYDLRNDPPFEWAKN